MICILFTEVAEHDFSTDAFRIDIVNRQKTTTFWWELSELTFSASHSAASTYCISVQSTALGAIGTEELVGIRYVNSLSLFPVEPPLPLAFHFAHVNLVALRLFRT